MLSASYGTSCYLNSALFNAWSAKIAQKVDIDGAHIACMDTSAILPLIAGGIAISSTIVSMFSKEESNVVDLSVFVIAPTHWIPVFNPLITIIVVKPFRQTFTTRKITNSKHFFQSNN
uniref:Uncharacterized protein n=1 Tax=Ditylenchus dipsaci TaxID=166011 RepID=A0A915EJN3_9BILA